MKYLLAILVLVIGFTSNAFCQRIYLKPLQSEDVVIKVTNYKLGYTASSYDIWNDLKEVMKLWKVKNVEKIRYNLQFILSGHWSDESPSEDKSFFVIEFYLIK